MDKQIPELSKSQTGDFHGFTPSPYEDESEDEDRSFHFHPVHHRYSRERIPDSIHLAGWGSTDRCDSSNEKVETRYHAGLISAINWKIKEHVDNVLLAAEGISARLF